MINPDLAGTVIFVQQITLSITRLKKKKLLLILMYHVFNPKVLIKITNSYSTTVVQYCNTPAGDLTHHDHDHHTLLSRLLLDWKHTGTIWFVAAKRLSVSNTKHSTTKLNTGYRTTHSPNCKQLTQNVTKFNIQSSEVMYFASTTVFISRGPQVVPKRSAKWVNSTLLFFYAVLVQL